jgi:hypothetical protein
MKPLLSDCNPSAEANGTTLDVGGDGYKHTIGYKIMWHSLSKKQNLEEKIRQYLEFLLTVDFAE